MNKKAIGFSTNFNRFLLPTNHSMKQQYGLIGFPLSHSFSPNYFHQKFEQNKIAAIYKSYPIEEISLLPNLLLQQPELKGLNVTIPHKTSVITYLNYISKDAHEIGAVNCIKIDGGKLFGFNTDYIGFTNSLKPLLPEDTKSALVLGSGGSAKAVQYALLQMGISYHIVSQSGKGNYNYADLNEEIIRAHTLIINTTPLGMYPHTEDSPRIPYSLLSEKHLLFDLIYNPAQTMFLKQGLANGALIKNGWEMLQLQAEKSWDIWNEEQDLSEFIFLK